MKNVVITGVSRGIGRALSLLFVQRGNKVIGLARSEKALKRLAGECEGLQGTFLPISMDVSQPDGDQMERIMGNESIDILINNAAILHRKAFGMMKGEEVDEVLAVNVKGPLLMTQLCLSGLRKAEAGCVLNIGSMGGIQGSAKFPGLSVYSASKGALAIMTECLAEELKDTGIHINCMALGGVRTDMLRAAFPDYGGGVPVGRMVAYIYHFCTESFIFFNGKVIPVSSSVP